jgi:hypothetical protein
MVIVKVGGEGIGDVDKPVSRDVYRIFSDEFQYFGIQIRWKLIRRPCRDGEREEWDTQYEGEDVNGECASHLCTVQLGQNEDSYIPYTPRGIAAVSIEFHLEA